MKRKKKTQRHGKRWTKEEERILVARWGKSTVESISKRLGRSFGGVIWHADLLKLGRPMRGRISMKEVCEQTGYGPKTIVIAAKIAGVDLHKCRVPSADAKRSNGGRGRLWGFDIDDVDRIIEVLNAADTPNYISRVRDGEWGGLGKPQRCRDCGTNERSHRARGLCERCYQRRSSSGVGFDGCPKVRRGRGKGYLDTLTP